MTQHLPRCPHTRARRRRKIGFPIEWTLNRQLKSFCCCSIGAPVTPFQPLSRNQENDDSGWQMLSKCQLQFPCSTFYVFVCVCVRACSIRPLHSLDTIIIVIILLNEYQSCAYTNVRAFNYLFIYDCRPREQKFH